MRRKSWMLWACWLVACAESAGTPVPDASVTAGDATSDAGAPTDNEGSDSGPISMSDAGSGVATDARVPAMSSDGASEDAAVPLDASPIQDAASEHPRDAARETSVDASMLEAGPHDSGAHENGGGLLADAATSENDAGDAAPEIPDLDAAAPAIGSPEAGVSKIAFATSIRYTGALGGLAGADQICADHAVAGGLAGEFRAWISTVDEAVVDRLMQSAVPYVRTDGVVVANDWSDLLDGSLAAPINRDEQGLAVSGDVWTGTLPDGTAYASDCAGFAEGNAAGASLCGSAASAGLAWTENLVVGCGTPLRLYCFEQ